MAAIGCGCDVGTRSVLSLPSSTQKIGLLGTSSGNGLGVRGTVETVYISRASQTVGYRHRWVPRWVVHIADEVHAVSRSIASCIVSAVIC